MLVVDAQGDAALAGYVEQARTLVEQGKLLEAIPILRRT